MDNHTRELLRRAFRSGARPFLREVGMLARNRLYGATHLVFEMRKPAGSSVEAGKEDHLVLSSYTTWDSVPEHTKAAIVRDLQGQYWGKEQWLQLGWRLWVGTIDLELAIVSWTREAGQCEDFFFPLSHDCAVIWQTVTVPAFRGRGLCAVVLRRLATTLLDGGCVRVYASCRDYNLSSRRAIDKAGFVYIGRGVVRKGSGTGIWYPVARPFTRG